MSVTSTDAQVFRAAAAYLEKHGWQQHANGGCGKPACLVGALIEVISVKRDNKSTLDCVRLNALREVLRARPGPHAYGLLSLWNDSVVRTADDVLDLLLETAAELENV